MLKYSHEFYKIWDMYFSVPVYPEHACPELTERAEGQFACLRRQDFIFESNLLNRVKINYVEIL